jgi:hypothetical protein
MTRLLIEIYKRNIPGIAAQVADVRDLFDGCLGGPLTPPFDPIAKEGRFLRARWLEPALWRREP